MFLNSFSNRYQTNLAIFISVQFWSGLSWLTPSLLRIIDVLYGCPLMHLCAFQFSMNNGWVNKWTFSNGYHIFPYFFKQVKNENCVRFSYSIAIYNIFMNTKLSVEGEEIFSTWKTFGLTRIIPRLKVFYSMNAYSKRKLSSLGKVFKKVVQSPCESSGGVGL